MLRLPDEIHLAVSALLGTMCMVVWAAADVIISKDLVIWDNEAMRLYCIIGAVLGSVCFGLYTASINGGPLPIGKLVVKVSMALIGSVLFTPPLIYFCVKKFGMPVNSDLLMGAAGAVAMTIVGVLHYIVPLVPVLINKTIGKWLGISVGQRKE